MIMHQTNSNKTKITLTFSLLLSQNLLVFSLYSKELLVTLWVLVREDRDKVRKSNSFCYTLVAWANQWIFIEQIVNLEE